MRLRSDIWVQAFIRRCAVEGAPAVLRWRGAAEAGAIFILIDRLDATCALYGPAPQSEVSAEHARAGIERLWARLHKTETVAVADAEARLAGPAVAENAVVAAEYNWQRDPKTPIVFPPQLGE